MCGKASGRIPQEERSRVQEQQARGFIVCNSVT